MANSHLQREPHHLRGQEDIWWYEERAGVCVVIECRDGAENYIGTKQVVIPWRSIRAALRRKDKEGGEGGS